MIFWSRLLAYLFFFNLDTFYKWRHRILKKNWLFMDIFLLLLSCTIWQNIRFYQYDKFYIIYSRSKSSHFSKNNLHVTSETGHVTTRFCLISYKRLKITYISLYKILFALSRQFDWCIIWWVLVEKKLATLNISHVTSPLHITTLTKNFKKYLLYFV